MLKRIVLYFKHRHHDKIRKQKLFLYKLVGFRDPKFDYTQHLKGSFWDYVRGTLKNNKKNKGK